MTVETTPSPGSEAETHRDSPLHETAKLERRLPMFYASFFYAFPAAIAWIWLYFTRPERSAELWAIGELPLHLAIGVGAAVVIVAASAACSRLFAWARRLESEFGWILGAQRAWEIVFIALVSGFAEEYLFRGALQEKFGIWIATAVFAIVHWPVNRNFLAWPFIAALVGLGLGGLREWTGTLWAPAAAHALINMVNLWRITRRFHRWDDGRVEAYVQRGASE